MREVESWSIYGLRENSQGSKYRYIGYTTLHPDDRLRLHRNDAKKKVAPVNTWINHLNGDVLMEIIESCPIGDKDFLFDREVHWISYYRGLQGSLEDKRTPDYLKNFQNGGGSGSLGTTLSDSHKESISSGVRKHFSTNGHKSQYEFWTEKYGKDEADRRLEDRGKKISAKMSGSGNHMYGKTGQDATCYGRVGELHPMFGKAHSEEAKAKMSKALKGRTLTEATKLRMSFAQHTRSHQQKIKDTCMWCQGHDLQEEIKKRELELNDKME